MDKLIQEVSPAQRLDGLAQKTALVLIFLAPLIFLPGTFFAAGVVKMLWGVLMATLPFSLWIFARMKEKAITLPRTPFLWVLVFLPLVYFISALLSGSVINAIVPLGARGESVFSLILLILVFANTIFLFSRVADMTRLLQVVMYSFSTLALIQLLRLLVGVRTFLPGVFGTNPASTLLGSWSDFAVFAGIALIIAVVYTTLSLGERFSRWISWLTIVLAMVVLTMVNVTAVWVTLSVLALAFLLYILSTQQETADSLQEKTSRRMRRIILPLSFFIVTFAFIFLGGSAAAFLDKALHVAYVDVRPSWSGTIDVAKASYANGGLFFGTGPGTFAHDWARFRPQGINITAFWATDFVAGIGFIPTVFVTAGLIGGVLWLMFLGWLLYLAFKVLWTRQSNKAVRAVSIILSLSAVYAIILLFVYNPQLIVMYLLFILFGLLVALARNLNVLQTVRISRDNPRDRFLNSILLTKGLLFTVMFVGLGVGQAVAQTIAQGVVRSFNEGDIATAEKHLARLNTLATGNILFDKGSLYFMQSRVKMRQINILLSKKEKLEKGDREKVKTLLQEAIAHAQKAVQHNPQDYTTYLFLGGLYEQMISLQVEGAYEAALAAYDKAARIAPTNPRIPLAKARAAFRANKLDDAQKFAREALKLKPNYTDAYYLLSQIAVKGKNLAEAIAATESAAILSPNNPGILFQLGVLQYSAKQYAKAAGILRRAVQINPQYANALYYLALSDIKLGNKKEALFALNQILKTNPKADSVKKMISQLQEGKKADTVPSDGEPSPDTPLKEAD